MAVRKRKNTSGKKARSSIAMGGVAIDVTEGDALREPCDVLALKYAQELFGVDALVHDLFLKAGRRVALPPPWGFRLEDGVSGVTADRLLFIGVPTLREFGYSQIRAFGQKVLSSLAGKAPETSAIAITLHGAGYGLDEVEAFEAEVAGLLDSITTGDVPEALQRITFVERNRGRAERMEKLLTQLIPTGIVTRDIALKPTKHATERLRSAGYDTDAKAHVFVAMPFKPEMDDVYHYGIQGPIRKAGYVCERADLASFTGDVLHWVRARIKSASFVVADLSEANPNVYLEVGYAWGCDIPTVLLISDPKELSFDVQGQRCLAYSKIKDLEKALKQELNALRKPPKANK